VTPAHADGIHEAVVASQAELLPWMPWAVDPTPAATRRHAAESEAGWKARTRFHFAVIERESGAILGVAGFNNEHPGAPELHYWIRTDHAGRGLTTEAARALVAWAASDLRVDRVWLWAGSDNAASRRVAEKLGFVHVGPLDWRPEGGHGTFAAERYELKLG
jgi:RimJ/RimL family protein N-acetyltransferase